MNREQRTPMKPFKTSIDHLLAEVGRLDILLQGLIYDIRAMFKKEDGSEESLTIEQEIDQILQHPIGVLRWQSVPNSIINPSILEAIDKLSHEINQRKAESFQQGITLRLDRLAKGFGLIPFDIDILITSLTPELESSYERIFSWLHNDTAIKRPTVALVLHLLSFSFINRLSGRVSFAPNSPLIKNNLIYLVNEPSQTDLPLINKIIKPDERIINYLFGIDDIDNRITAFAKYALPHINISDLILPDDKKNALINITNNYINNNTPFIFYFQGVYGVGKETAVHGICSKIGIGLITVEVDKLIDYDTTEFKTSLALIHREAILQEAGIYWKDFDLLLKDDKSVLLSLFICELEDYVGLCFLSGELQWEPADVLKSKPLIRIELPYPGFQQRSELWHRALKSTKSTVSNTDIALLADKFRLTGGQINDSVKTAENLVFRRDSELLNVTIDDLYAACRLQSNQKLSLMAKKIKPNYVWDDIVLPNKKMKQLKAICNHIKYRSIVYEKWGFEQKLSLGKGLNVLFTGPSGVGKTMSAEVLAGELGLDLYKIDLSMVVSKYIGETEKNLSRIFFEAETSNAIIFFDEADSLFSKRSEVHDSHDRHANIETCYLLQKMEEYNGMVILATNLGRNLDDAFIRRIHFSIDFVLPDNEDRLLIWGKIWPAATPLNKDINLEFMANQFDIPGGNIRNIALAAAFTAAKENEPINMEYLICATRMEYEKMGKVATEDDFKY